MTGMLPEGIFLAIIPETTTVMHPDYAVSADNML
jgi:hypothetical protein